MMSDQIDQLKTIVRLRKRDLERCTHDVAAARQAIVAAQVGLNEPRYATALNIIKAKKKPIDTLSADELGITEADRKMRLKNFELPPPKQPCRIIDGASADQATELIRILADEIQTI